jgi:hypothetical protein
MPWCADVPGRGTWLTRKGFDVGSMSSSLYLLQPSRSVKLLTILVYFNARLSIPVPDWAMSGVLRRKLLLL